MAAQYRISKVNNYILVIDLVTSQEVLCLPGKNIYYRIETQDGEPSPILFFYVLGGMGATVRSGGFDIYDSAGGDNFDALTYPQLLTFLRTNTGT